jgi:uncharacterized membrane protein
MNREAGASRIVGPIDEGQVVTLTGNVHPMARGEFDLGVLGSETVLAQMVLELRPSAARQAGLDALVEAQHNPESPLYHQWLTPAEFGVRFGASAGDVARIAGWLRGHGFTVSEVAASNRLVIFSGTAEQVGEAFHTEIHRYKVDGVEHIANVRDPQIPLAFAGVVGGLLSLHDFRRMSEMSGRKELGSRPEYSTGTAHYLFPADWATIYDLNSLYSAGTKGAGTSIAIVGRSNITLSDVATFRAASGLPANAPSVIFVSTNPGLLAGDQDESTLDVEWSGAIAPATAVKFVVGSSTATTDGVDLSAQYIVNHATAQVVSTSYGSCEQYMGASELVFYNALWQQAASEGISALVSSGDSGAAGCNGGSSTTGTVAGVNGLCSSPYSTCVGGTEFNEGSSSAKYWSASNTSSDESALSYIPEKVWNESALDGGSGLWSSTGGASVVYAAPNWQKGVTGANAANGMRAVPDVAMSSAAHDGYIIVENGSYWVIAGTSAASPSLAGLMALVVQSHGGKGQGNANPGLYALLTSAKNPFHPTPSGNNSVPGVSGFTASGGPYNLATGLGSVDGAVLVSSWGAGTSPVTGTNFALTQSATSGSVLTGKTVGFTVGVTESGSANNAVALTIKAPSGVMATVSPSTILPGTVAVVSLAVGAGSAAGAQSISVTGSNSSGTQTLTYALTVTAPPTLTMTAASSSVAIVQGAVAKTNLTAVIGGSFSGNIGWSAIGLPSGVTAAWSSNPMVPAAGGSSNVETLTLTATLTAKIASTSVTLTAVGDGLTASKTMVVQVTQAPGITLAVAPASLSMQSLATANATVTATPVGGLTIQGGTKGNRNQAMGNWIGVRGGPLLPKGGSTIGSSTTGTSIGVVSGLPAGFTAAWSAPTMTSAGAVVWTLSLTGSSKALAGSSTLNLSAQVIGTTGTAYTASAALPMLVTLTPPTLTLTVASNSLVLTQGKTTSEAVALAGNGSYAGAVTLSVSGLPPGVTAAWSSNPVTVSAAGWASILTLTAASTAKVGSATITVTANGDGLTATKQVTLQIAQGPGVQVALSVSSLSMTHTAAASVNVTMTNLGGLSAPMTLLLSGLPNGVTSSLSNVSLTAAGETATLTLSGSSKAAVGTTAVSIGVSASSNGSTYTATQILTLQLK